MPILKHIGVAILRMPLLPPSVLDGAIGYGSDVPSTDNAFDTQLITHVANLRRVLRSSPLADAIEVAAPQFAERLSRFLETKNDDLCNVASLLESPLPPALRYAIRASYRCTPFGLFAAVGQVRIGDASFFIRREASLTPKATIDYEALWRVRRELESNSALARKLLYRRNTSLYRLADEWRYAELRVSGIGYEYVLCKATSDEFLEAVLASSSGLRSVEELVAAIRSVDEDVSPDEAFEYIFQLVRSQLLISSLELPVAGTDPELHILETLRRHPIDDPVIDRLTNAVAACARTEACESETIGPALASLDKAVAKLDSRSKPGRRYQVDLGLHNINASLDARLVSSITGAVEAMNQWGRPLDAGLDDFRERFTKRYENRLIPLVTVLDEDVGIGFASSMGEPSALLEKVPLQMRRDSGRVPLGALSHLERLVLSRLAEGEKAICISLPSKTAAADAGLSATLGVMASLVRVPEIERVTAYVGGVFAPSAGILISRFAHLSPALRQMLENLVNAEADLEPHADLAEIVHLPAGRVGNVLRRPAGRATELEFLGSSSSTDCRKLNLADLLVTVRGGEIILYDRRTGRRVLPRLTSAHNFSWVKNLATYRFLGALQQQGLRTSSFAWPAFLSDALHLPRVLLGDIIIARRCWRLSSSEIASLDKASAAAQWRACLQLFERRGIPQKCVFEDGDNSLVIDIRSPLAVTSLFQVIRWRQSVQLHEYFEPGLLDPTTGESIPNEVVIPLVRRVPIARSASEGAGRAQTPEAKAFPVDGWLFVKMYCGTAMIDRLLSEQIAPLRDDLRRLFGLETWFFVRYRDPEPHLRLRFKLPRDPETLKKGLMHLLAWCKEVVELGLAWDCQLVPYEPETLRYGGREAMLASEFVFRDASDLVLDGLRRIRYSQDRGNARWLFACKAVDVLLSAFRLSLSDKANLMRKAAGTWSGLFQESKNTKKAFADLYRKNRAVVEAILSGDLGTLPEDVAQLVQMSEKQTAALAESCLVLSKALTTCSEEETSEVQLSHLHMLMNRVFRDDVNSNEYVLYELLARAYYSLSVRSASRKAGSADGMRGATIGIDAKRAFARK